MNLGKSDDGCAATNTEVLIIEEIGQLANKCLKQLNLYADLLVVMVSDK